MRQFSRYAALLAVAVLASLGAAGAQASPRHTEGLSAGYVAAVDDGASVFQETDVLTADGSVEVTQRIRWVLPEGRHGIYRDVQVRAGYQDQENQYRYYELSEVSVESPTGAPTDITILDEGAMKRIRIGSPSQTVSGEQEYIVRFQLDNVVNDIGDGTAEFYYNLVDSSNDFDVQGISATVKAPAAATQVRCYYGELQESLGCDATAGNPATFAVPDLTPRQGATIVASYPRDAFGELTPDIRSGDVTVDTGVQVSPETSRSLALLAMGGGVLVPLLAAAGMGLAVWRRGRDEHYAGLTPGLIPGWGQDVPVVTSSQQPTVAVQFSPPDGVQPGMLGTIVDEEVNLVDVTATVVDLAVRGYLTIGPAEQAGFGFTEDWVLTRRTPPANAVPLHDYEQRLLDGIFPAQDSVQLSSLKNHFASTLASVKSMMYAEVTRRGWFRESPERARSAFRWLAGLLGLGGVLTLFWGFSVLGPYLGDSGWGTAPIMVLAGGSLAAAAIVWFLGNRLAARSGLGGLGPEPRLRAVSRHRGGRADPL